MNEALAAVRKISDSDLRLFEDRIKRTKANGVDMFDVSHGALSMHIGGFTGNGKWQLVFSGTSVEEREAAYLLASISPPKFEELVRGYRIAKRAGLL